MRDCLPGERWMREWILHPGNEAVERTVWFVSRVWLTAPPSPGGDSPWRFPYDKKKPVPDYVWDPQQSKYPSPIKLDPRLWQVVLYTSCKTGGSFTPNIAPGTRPAGHAGLPLSGAREAALDTTALWHNWDTRVLLNSTSLSYLPQSTRPRLEENNWEESRSLTRYFLLTPEGKSRELKLTKT